MTDVDALFASYCAHREPAELGAVFDATAADLLLLAVHLLGGRADAEDAVQSTFLAAIAAAARFTPGRPVRPWLAGILVNQVHRLRARRRAGELSEVADGASPVDAVVAAEASAELFAAITDLPDPYREVLLLRARRGLDDHEIAEELRRPLETVRTQRKRGLDRLRGVLSPSLLVMATALFTSAKGLAAVRSQVVSAAAPTPVAAASISGWLLGAAAVALTATAWLALGPASAVSTLVEPVGTSVRATDDLRGTAREAVDAPAVRRLAASSERARDTIEIVGRCVDEHGAPVAGALMCLASWNSSAAQVASTRRLPLPRDVCTQAGADGTFSLRIEPHAVFGYDLSARAPGRYSAHQRWSTLDRARDRVTLGDLALVSAHPLRGRVVDERGAPVGDVAIYLPSTARPEHPGRALQPLRARTDASGQFAFAAAPVGEHSVGVDAPGFQVRGFPRAVVPAPGDRMAELVLTARPHSVRGRVVDPAGRGVADILIEARSADWTERARSGLDGSFAIYGDADFSDAAGIAFSCDTHTFEDAPRPVRWGADGELLRVLPPGSLRVVVREAIGGAPVTRFSVRCVGRGPVPDRLAELGGHHVDGVAEIGSVSAREVVLMVQPGDEAFERAVARAVVVADGAATVEVALRRTQTRRVLVRDAAGPVVGETVELIDAAAERSSLGAAAGSAASFESHRRRLFPEVCAVARTGADGAADLKLASYIAEPWLRVRTFRHEPAFVAAPSPWSAERPAEMVLVAGGELVGHVGPAATLDAIRAGLMPKSDRDSVPANPWVVLKPWSESVPIEGLFEFWADREIGADGTYRVSGVPAGTYAVFLAAARHPVLSPQIAMVEMGVGRRQQLDLDVRPLAPASLRGVLRVDGALAPGVTVSLRGAAGYRSAEVTTDAGGRFVWPALPGGRYLLMRSSGTPASDSEWFDLSPGASLDREFDLIGHQIEFQVTASDGRSLAGLRLQLIGTEHGATAQCDLDSRGHGVATGVVPGRYQVAVLGGQAQRSTLAGEVEVPRAAPIAPVSVQVAPAGR